MDDMGVVQGFRRGYVGSRVSGLGFRDYMGITSDDVGLLYYRVCRETPGLSWGDVGVT